MDAIEDRLHEILCKLNWIEGYLRGLRTECACRKVGQPSDAAETMVHDHNPRTECESEYRVALRATYTKQRMGENPKDSIHSENE